MFDCPKQTKIQKFCVLGEEAVTLNQSNPANTSKRGVIFIKMIYGFN